MLFIRRTWVFIVSLFYCAISISAEQPSTIVPTVIAVGEIVKYGEYPNRDQHKPLLLLSENLGIHWTIPLIAGFANDDDMNSEWISTSCTNGPQTACYTVGWNNNTEKQILSLSSDGGHSWSAQYTPEDSVPTKISCTGNDPKTATCAILSHKNGELFLNTNHDGGEYYAITQMVRPYMVDPFLVTGDVSCTGYDSDTRCVFVSGIKTKSGYEPILYMNSYKNYFWRQKAIDGLSKDSMLWKVSCAGQGNDAVCVAIGGETPLSGKPVMAVTTNGGDTWHEPSVVKQLSQDKQLTAISCVKNDTANFCVAGGSLRMSQFNGGEAQSFFINYLNTNNRWKIRTSKKLQKYYGAITDLSCTANNTASLCVAVGLRDPRTYAPVILVSTDQGNHWKIKKGSGLTKTNYLDHIQCVSNQENITCFANGGKFSDDSSAALVMSSSDLGNHWDIATPMQDHMSIQDMTVTY